LAVGNQTEWDRPNEKEDQMKTPKVMPVVSSLLVLMFVLSACDFSAAQSTSTPVPTDTPAPTATSTSTPTNTPRPSPTPRPTKTPNLAATQKAEEYNAEAQKYFDDGYLSTADGQFREFDDFEVEWAQLNYFQWWQLNHKANDFYLRAHFKWDSAYRNADTSGCGFLFALTPDNLYYAVFLDRSEVLFLTKTGSGIRTQGRTRGSGRVKFDMPAEADFTLIVNGHTAYVLVDDELIGEYSLSQSKAKTGDLALTVLSGTNKDYGTRCEMTDIHVFIPQ
jgi:hypothetical protein